MSSFTERLAKMTPVEKERTLASVRRMNEYVFSLEDMNTLVYNNVVKTLRTIFEEDTTEIDPAVIVEAIELDIIDDYDKLFQTDDDFNSKLLFDENTKYFPTILLYLCGARDACLTKEARTQIALALIKSGKCDVDCIDEEAEYVDDNDDNKCYIPLVLACKFGYEEIALALVKYSKERKIAEYNNTTTLASACRYNLPRVAEALIDYDTCSHKLFNNVLSPSTNALLIALKNNMWSVVKRLINGVTASYDLAHVDENGMTACDWFREKNMYYDEEIPTLYRTKMFELIEKETGRDDPRYRRIIEAEADPVPVPVPTKFSCSSSGGEACAPTVIRDGHNQSLTVIAGDTEVEIEKRLTEMIVKLTS